MSRPAGRAVLVTGGPRRIGVATAHRQAAPLRTDQTTYADGGQRL
jgi:NAD(P)-dependent dehydrogenase (short-subunit alcohol dehydrogenase family)